MVKLLMAAALALMAAGCGTSTPAGEAALMRRLQERAAIPREPAYGRFQNVYAIGVSEGLAAPQAPSGLAQVQHYACPDGVTLELEIADDFNTAVAVWSDAGATPLRRPTEGAHQWESDTHILALRPAEAAWSARGAGAVTVVRGDTLSRIAQRVYGDWRRAADIAAANADQIVDPNRIEIGQVLTLPGESSAAARRCERTD